MRNIQEVVQTKEGRNWKTTLVITDVNEIHRRLMKDLIAKKLHQCTYIRSIKDVTNYDGTRNITVTYDNNVRSIYTIEW